MHVYIYVHTLYIRTNCIQIDTLLPVLLTYQRQVRDTGVASVSILPPSLPADPEREMRIYYSLVQPSAGGVARGTASRVLSGHGSWRVYTGPLELPVVVSG